MIYKLGLSSTCPAVITPEIILYTFFFMGCCIIHYLNLQLLKNVTNIPIVIGKLLTERKFIK